MAKKKKKSQLAPIMTMLLIIIAVILLTTVCSLLNMESNQTSIVGNNLETSIVVVKNVISREGISYLFNNIMTNFELLQPLVLLILSLMAISIGKTSGLFKHLFHSLRRLKPQVLTFGVVLISVISTVIGDYSYIILIPLSAVLYEYAGRSPVLGVITSFIGITLGYGTGLFYNYDDYLLGLMTQQAANVSVDANYSFNLYSNMYIMIISTIAITFILTFLIDKYLSKRVAVREKYDDELITDSNALKYSVVTFFGLLVLIFVAISPLTKILLDNNQGTYIAKLFSDASPFNNSFIFLFLVVMAIVSLVYGFVSKNFKDNHEYCWGFAKQFDNIGYLFILMFLSSILVSIINWSNIGVVVANKLINILSVFNITGMPLIVITFFMIIVMSIFLPNNVEKWMIISPILIPLFMRGNLTPDFAQFVFKVADSVGKVLTPTFIYFIIMVGFIQKYNGNENKITLFGTFKLIWPIILTMVLFWLLLLIIWYVAGLPLGLGAYATM